jgi:hypothetical protein
MNIVSGILILIAAFFGIKHGWGLLTLKPGKPNMFSQWHISRCVQIVIAILTLAAGIFVLFPTLFLTGNLINIAIILLVIVFQLKIGSIREAMIEIPFLVLSVVMIYLGHPLRAGL